MNTRVIAVIVAVVVTLIVGGRLLGRQRAGELRVAHDSLTAALDADTRQKAQLGLLKLAAARSEARARAEAARADSLERVKQRAVVKYVIARDSAPADCAPVIAAANEALADAEAEAQERRQEAQDALNSLVHTQAALDSVSASNGRLRAAAVALDRASRPGLLERLTPRFGVGGAAGVDPLTRRPAVAVGVTFGWTF